MSQPQILLCTPQTPEGEATMAALVERILPPLVQSELARFYALQEGALSNGVAIVIPDNHLAEDLRTKALTAKFDLVHQLALDVTDQEAVEAEIAQLARTAELEGKFHIAHWARVTDAVFSEPEAENTAQPDINTGKFIEIYYDIAAIPPDYDHPLDFRNAAMERIEVALAEAGIGEWSGAESGMNLKTGAPEVNFGFEVTAFEPAEATVREAIRGTPFEGIREIVRSEM